MSEQQRLGSWPLLLQSNRLLEFGGVVFVSTLLEGEYQVLAKQGIKILPVEDEDGL